MPAPFANTCDLESHVESKHPGSELLGVKHKQKENPWIVDRQFLSAALKRR